MLALGCAAFVAGLGAALGDLAVDAGSLVAGDSGGLVFGSLLSGTPCSCIVPSGVPLPAALAMFTANLHAAFAGFFAVRFYNGSSTARSVS